MDSDLLECQGRQQLRLVQRGERAGEQHQVLLQGYVVWCSSGLFLFSVHSSWEEARLAGKLAGPSDLWLTIYRY